MSLNDEVSAERVHIAFFGRRNAGKSSLVNAILGQEISVVSDIPGTTTDAVRKSMELLPLGPVVIIDTPGFDDEGDLGEKRVAAARKILREADIAVLVIDGSSGNDSVEKQLKKLFVEKGIPFVNVFTKKDINKSFFHSDENSVCVSSLTGEGINELKIILGKFANRLKTEKVLVADIVNAGDTVVLVIPVDKAAPKGRIILPQQQVLRELLDTGCSIVCCRNTELRATLNVLKIQPSLVITDSQVFEEVDGIVPSEIFLTSFSIIFARYKGDLNVLMNGANKLDKLSNGDTILISEGCTHHRQCGDIGTEKMPRWIENYTGKKLNFRFTSGGDFPEDLDGIKLIVHCGGCMLNEKQMKHRMTIASVEKIPIVNYGIAIAKMHGILDRSVKAFRKIEVNDEKH